MADDLRFNPETLEFGTTSPNRSVGGRSGRRSRTRSPRGGRHTPVQPVGHAIEEEEPGRHHPWFCACAFTGCCIMFVWEIARNGWKFQPFSCPAMCAFGPCYENGEVCESNPLLGPTNAVMNELGAKNDDAIFADHEWWRVVTCNWLHAGLFHLLLNMMAVLNLGVGLERRFGFWRIGILYVLSGLFGTMVSVVFLPGVLSVGASASVFGLVGACWADVVQNYCAVGTLRGSGCFSLFILTALNLCIGLTPFVDNFMHLGGFIAGLIIGMLFFSKKHVDSRGRRVYTCMQRELVFCASILFLVGLGGCIAAGASTEVQDVFRSCTFCEKINCVEISLFTSQPWWSCCIAKTPGTCSLVDNLTSVIATCNHTDAPAYTATCDRSECSFDPDDGASVHELCERLCSDC